MAKQPDENQKPTKEDAALLVQLFSLAQTERVARSFLWYYDFVGDVKDPKEIDFKAFLKNIREDQRDISGGPRLHHSLRPSECLSVTTFSVRHSFLIDGQWNGIGVT